MWYVYQRVLNGDLFVVAIDFPVSPIQWYWGVSSAWWLLLKPRDDIPYMKWKIKHVPNHQPVTLMGYPLVMTFTLRHGIDGPFIEIDGLPLKHGWILCSHWSHLPFLIFLWRFFGDQGLWMYPLVNVYTTMENHHFLVGKLTYKWPCSIATLNYQRVIPFFWIDQVASIGKFTHGKFTKNHQPVAPCGNLLSTLGQCQFTFLVNKNPRFWWVTIPKNWNIRLNYICLVISICLFQFPQKHHASLDGHLGLRI